jgi:hypothetical protein
MESPQILTQLATRLLERCMGRITISSRSLKTVDRLPFAVKRGLYLAVGFAQRGLQRRKVRCSFWFLGPLKYAALDDAHVVDQLVDHIQPEQSGNRVAVSTLGSPLTQTVSCSRSRSPPQRRLTR